NDVVRVVTGPTPGFYHVIHVMDTHTLALETNAGNGGGVSYRVHAFTDGSQGGGADEVSFLTTGKTPYSRPIQIHNETGGPRTFPMIAVSFPDLATNPSNRTPLKVHFDGSASLNEFGSASPPMQFTWNFGDGTPNSTARIVDHIFTTPAPAGRTVTLTTT